MLHVERSTIPIDILEEMIALGEGYKTQFCEHLPSAGDTATTLCAFANTKGGNLFIGLSSDGETVGIRDKYGTVAQIEGANDLISPQPRFTVQTLEFKKREIILITVGEGDKKPYCVNVDEEQIVYLRSGEKNVPATRKELRSFIKRGSGHDTE
jgi:ATP-dependent DNA helicase RecG